MVLKLQMTVFCLISFRERNLTLYVDSMKALVIWFFALNFTHYQRWLPVHIKDMLELKDAHPAVYEAFQNGCFVGQKSGKRFSFIPLNQIHEQKNVKVKCAGGALDILEKDNALRRWMLAGPEQANLLEDFESLFENNFTNMRDFHHDEGQASQMRFKKHVEDLTRAWEDIGSPFEEECAHLINIYDRTIVPEEVSECIFNLKHFGKSQYENFVSDVLITKKVSFWDPISANKLKLFDFKPATSSKPQSAVKILKKNNRMFFELLLNASCRGGETGDFFSCEPFEYPISLSNNG